MGNVIDPKPPQWKRKEPLEDVPEDRVLAVADQYIKFWQQAEVDPTVVHLAALRLVVQGIISNYRKQQGDAAAAELARQADELADHYKVE